jgi:hypothetical protein
VQLLADGGRYVLQRHVRDVEDGVETTRGVRLQQREQRLEVGLRRPLLRGELERCADGSRGGESCDEELPVNDADERPRRRASTTSSGEHEPKQGREDGADQQRPEAPDPAGEEGEHAL